MVWEHDPELFLHRPHFPLSSTIYTKRCLDMTKTVPLVANDFDNAYPYRPMDFQQLVMSTTTWTQPDFQRLLDYISPNHYLVNCQGLVFLEVFPFDENENIAASVPIYVRLLDVIDLTNFGFHTRPNKVPPRTIKYIVDGYDAQVEDPPVIVPPVVVIPPVVVVPPVIVPPVVVIPPVVVVPPVIDPPDGRPKVDPSWMTDNWGSDWVDIYGLKKISYDRGGKFEVTRAGTRYGDDNTTNVGREYFHGVRWFGVPDSAWPGTYMPVMVVAGLGDRITKARFNPKVWGMFENGGTWYPMKSTDGILTDYNAVVGGAPWPPTSS